MKISLITDECSHDPFTAMELARGWGIEHCEIRHAYRWRVPEGPAWASDLVAAAVKAYGMTVTAISPGLFKPVMRADGTRIPIDTPSEIRRHIEELLPRFCEFAARLNTRFITVFAPPKPAGAEDTIPPLVIDALAEAAQDAAMAGFTLLLENGPGSWADTGAASAAVLEAVGSPALRLTWDPANVRYGGFTEDPVRQGYPAVKPHVANVHVKDAASDGGAARWVMLGEGQIDWARQIAALRADGYRGYLTVEPHLQYESPVGLVDRTGIFLARLREFVGP